MKHESLEAWVSAIARDIQKIDHDTGWCECVGQRDAGPETFFAFITLDGRKARRAIELLAASGLLCESPTADDDGDGEEYLPYLEHLRTYPVAALVDCLRSLADTALIRKEPFREAVDSRNNDRQIAARAVRAVAKRMLYQWDREHGHELADRIERGDLDTELGIK